MKIECLKENISKGISLAEHVTGKKLPLLILGKVLIEAKEKSIIIKATNLDIGLEIKVPGKIYTTGIISINGSLLENHLNNLPEHSVVVMEKVNDNFIITTTASQAVMTCELPIDYPPIPKFSIGDKIDNFSLEVKAIIDGLVSVVYAAAITDIKPELSSVYLHTKESGLTLTATDSFRLAEKKINLSKIEEGNGSTGILIPQKNATEIIRILNEAKGLVSVQYNKNQISFQTENSYITSRLIDGLFPSYEALLPKSFTTQIVALKDDILSALRLVSVFSDRFNQVNIRIIPEDGIFELTTKNQGVGESTTRVEATIEGEALDITVNARYLADCFNSINKDSISIGFNGKSKPALLRAVGDRSFSYLVMPLHQ